MKVTGKGAMSPDTVRKRPQPDSQRRIGRVALKNTAPHPKKDLFPSEPSVILETDGSNS